MKYVCSICGYVYDEAKEGTLFSDLPDTWTCALCGAGKSDFVPEKIPQVVEEKRKSEETEISEEVKLSGELKEQVVLDEDLKKLSAAQISAICSNLARGCEKQYKHQEAELFRQLASYFSDITETEIAPTVETIDFLLGKDLAEGYSNVKNATAEEVDRGAMRVCVWGEKVTRVLKGLLNRYNTEGEDFLKNTEIWVCTVCGFVYVGERPPLKCPICKVSDWKFESVEGRKTI